MKGDNGSGSSRFPSRFREGGWRLHGLSAFFVVLAFGGPCLAQSQKKRIWDIQPGMHVSTLPTQDFVGPGCGNRGGPRGAAITGFGGFAQCAPEPSGFREIWFEYDDTSEYVALARRESPRARATSVLDQPVVLSLLVNDGGFIRGYRIITDTRADHDLRLHAHEIALHFNARFSLDGHCVEIPATVGETPIDGEFVKERCEKEANGARVISEARFYFRPGQQLRDPNTGQPMANAFESSARLEVVWMAAADMTPPLETVRSSSYANSREAFLAGATKDCPRCDLSGVDLRYRDLSFANLGGANLSNSLLHRTILRGTNLQEANLGGANLNRASLALAQLSSASLADAMLYQADGQRANLAGADLRGVLAGKANFAAAELKQVDLTTADLAEARFVDADLTNAKFEGASLTGAIFDRARLVQADLNGASLMDARLRGADLTKADLRNADLSRADLTGAEFQGADFSNARLTSANLAGANQTDARFSGAVMPDNSKRP